MYVRRIAAVVAAAFYLFQKRVQCYVYDAHCVRCAMFYMVSVL